MAAPNQFRALIENEWYYWTGYPIPAVIELIRKHRPNINMFTGYIDKFDNKIFEGDILNDKAVVKWFHQLTWDSGGSPHPGFWCEEWMDYGDDLSYHSGFSEETFVIGNIYEEGTFNDE